MEVLHSKLDLSFGATAPLTTTSRDQAPEVPSTIVVTWVSIRQVAEMRAVAKQESNGKQTALI